MDRSIPRRASVSSVSSNRGKDSGLPLILGRVRFTLRADGRVLGVKAGELVGEADMRPSWSAVSSSAFRFRELGVTVGVDTVTITMSKYLLKYQGEKPTLTSGGKTGILVEMRWHRRSSHQAVHDGHKQLVDRSKGVGSEGEKEMGRRQERRWLQQEETQEINANK